METPVRTLIHHKKTYTVTYTFDTEEEAQAFIGWADDKWNYEVDKELVNYPE